MADIEIIDNGILIVSLHGELDNHEANRIRSHISSSIFSGQVRSVIWDLARLGFMDSAGIGLILGRMRDLAPLGGETLILNPSATMEKIFTFSGLGPNIRHCTVDLAIVEIGGVLHEQ
ncbi:anti-sigma factor antagonist [Sporosarcina sp. JAI121]|uniref:anti-sigma factor antagonist n=1 Tax=Sporosarcina sp. JAI121 TaxID=2723064 RepID=UPI0015C9E391|nr:anti-sigma factor antagonist [Sporosarcina sp. JAI121]NYF24458.1 stage II sporulation protein AA (anti-sigma F factor antagonist) [Sporosarcina sp. JAI121]